MIVSMLDLGGWKCYVKPVHKLGTKAVESQCRCKKGVQYASGASSFSYDRLLYQGQNYVKTIPHEATNAQVITTRVRNISF